MTDNSPINNVVKFPHAKEPTRITPDETLRRVTSGLGTSFLINICQYCHNPYVVQNGHGTDVGCCNSLECFVKLSDNVK